MGRKGGSKRQASLDARKQILKVRGDYLELSDDEEDDEVVEITEAPAKKYKVTARKSDGERNVLRIVRDAEPTLELEVWADELSSVQLMARKAAQSARVSIQTLIDDTMKENNGRLLTNTPQLTAIELSAYLGEHAKKQTPPPTVARPVGRPIGMRKIAPLTPAIAAAAHPQKAYSVLMDQRTAKTVVAPTPQAASTARLEAPVPKKKAFLKGYTAPTTTTTTTTMMINPPPMIPIIRTNLPIITQPLAVAAATTTTTVAAPAKGAAVVDLTSDEAKTTSSADSKEVSFNKLQGKTFPSLVVVARPSLNVVEGAVDDNRNSLDRKVKRLLVYPPAQFAEYLIQQGLVKSEHFCHTHPGVKLKLGMYSDASRFPNSGGYIWISECCPPKFLSVFHESLFEGQQAPSTNFKLIYHWSCQTNVQNVLQWVKVENIYLKGLYTWLRGICTVALHTHFPILGGLGTVVEVGVISLGTTTHDGANRHVKVEVLGVLEKQTKRLMLRAVDPNNQDGDKPVKRRFSRILEPLLDWVHPESTLVIDMTIEKHALFLMGFKNIVRNGAAGATNQNVMDYLRRIVPRMFQNTLSLLSRQIIQQFLDELVWREVYGNTAYDAFHNIQKHISEQTRIECGTTFFSRLNKVAANPFKRWSLAPFLKKPSLSKQARPKQYGAASGVQAASGNTQQTQSGLTVPRPFGNVFPARVAQIPKQLTSLEPYYYGVVECEPAKKEIQIEALCPLCQKMQLNNTDLMLHLFRHVAGADYFCKYCLVDCGSKHNLYTHLELKHATETKAGRFFNCLICHDKFNSVMVLGKHMSIEHSPSELPYHCGTCDFKNSSHKIVIDHFYRKHKQEAALQCPFCLQVTDLKPGDSALIAQAVNDYMQHLLAHTKKGKNPKGAVKKCARCDLQFLTKEEFDAHGDTHVCYKNEPNFVSYPEPKITYKVPKSLRDNELREVKQPQVDYLIKFTVDEGSKCKECRNVMDADHFKEANFCLKGCKYCKYQTMCKAALLNHRQVCVLHQKEPFTHPLDFEMFCVCGFKSREGNALAGHLAVCERKSAYPSAEAAAQACVTPGMLDVLGLVRKDDSKEPEDVAKPARTRPETRRRKRKWRLSISDNEEDADDPDYSTSDEDFRLLAKKRRAKPNTPDKLTANASGVNASASKEETVTEDLEENDAMEEQQDDKDEDDAAEDMQEEGENEADGDVEGNADEAPDTTLQSEERIDDAVDL